MNEKYSEAGNRGKDVRSDCWVQLRLTGSGGIKVNLKSKVEVLYGESNRKLITAGLSYFGIRNCEINVEDSGALPYVIMARLETAVRQLKLDEGKQYLPDWQYDVPPSNRERFRRSRLYVPGDQPKLAINAAIHRPDGLILDLEDAVAPSNKEAARILVRNALRTIDFMGAERMVRINQLPLGVEDLEEIIPQKPDLILIPKTETADQVLEVAKTIDEISAHDPSPRDIYLMPIIESGLGVINAYSIASASKKNVAIAIGLEDYTADIGTQRTITGRESFFARCMLINAARAANIQAIDTVFSDVSDMDGLRESVLEAKSLGFDGKGCIHPRLVDVIHHSFAPGEKEIEKAKKIVVAYEEAEKKGLGVVALGSKMIDPPVVKRAIKTIEAAVQGGLISQNWQTEEML